MTRIIFCLFAQIFLFTFVLQISSTSANLIPSSLGEKLNKTLDKATQLPNATITGTTSVIKDLPNNILSTTNILSLGKNAILGLPFEVTLTLINELCSLVVAANGTKPYRTPNASVMNFILLTNNGNVTVKITDSMSLWRHPLFDPKKKSMFFITGWLTDLNDDNQPNHETFNEMWAAFKKRDDYNFVFIDSARYIDTLYSWSAFNTVEIGNEIGKALALLSDFIPDMYIHVMGHSLGAHISGATGVSYQFYTNGKRIPRITGLDPANPCFNEGETLTGLMRGDADFVDVVHTNNGALGKREPCGDADFYPNGVVVLQPGSFDISSSHSRAVSLFAETVVPGGQHLFKAVQCNSIFALDSGRCKRKPVDFGLEVPADTKGNYFFRTSGRPPYTT